MIRSRTPKRLLFMLGSVSWLFSLCFLVYPHVRAAPVSDGFSIRFFGNGRDDIDRIKIPLEPHNPVDIGDSDFTIEWWMKSNPGENNAQTQCKTNDGWIYGNILFDRDIWGSGDSGDYGIALNRGRIAVGVNREGEGTTVCGEIVVDDGSWHHVAVTREFETGMIRIFVDGVMDASDQGPVGDISYRDGRSTGYSDDPYLVIGAEKHDAGLEYPSYSGWVDEVRISSTLRYLEGFTPPSITFSPDEQTAALFHFDEGPAGACQGSILNASMLEGAVSGECRFGGQPSQGPMYDLDTPFIQIRAETATATESIVPSATVPVVLETSTPTLEPSITSTVTPLQTTSSPEQPVQTAIPTSEPLQVSEKNETIPLLLVGLGVFVVILLVIYIVSRRARR
jgi:hypothetical protein